MPEYDAVVVGAGPNGLAAAVTVAREGGSVLVIEAGERVGGGCRSAELTLPGFVHDVCSAVHVLGAASPFLAQLPLEDHGLRWVHPDLPLAHPLDGGRAGALHRDVDATAAALDADGADGAAWRRSVGSLAVSWDALAESLLRPIAQVPRHPLTLARFGIQALQPAAAYVRRRFRQPVARSLFAGMAAHAFLPLEHPMTASFGLVLAAAGHAVGWPFASGGSQRVADALASYLGSLGGRVETGRRVRSLGELPPARAVLLDVTPGQLLELAGERVPGPYRRRLARFRRGPGVFKLDYALDTPVPWTADACRRAGTVHVAGSLDELADAERAVARGRHPDRPFVLAVQQSTADPSRAPEGRHTLWAYCHVPNGSTVDMTGAVEDQIERFAPGFRDRVLARHAMDCSDFERYNPNFAGGDISAGAHDGLQLLLRPTASVVPYATPVPDVYLCSASTPPGAGVHGMCGHLAARAALRRSLRA